MSRYEGSLRMPGENGSGLGVTVDLSDAAITVRAGDAELGTWNRGQVLVNAQPDGFHMRVEGEEVILDISDDAHFAVELGLMTAPPLLRRRMAAIMREE